MLFKFILSYYKKAPLKMFFGFGMLVLVDIIQLIIPRIIQKAIDFISISQEDYSYLLHLALLIIALAVIIGFCRFFWRMIIIGTSHYIEMIFKNDLYEHLLLFSSSFFNRHQPGDIMAHMTNDMKAIKRATSFGVIAGFDSIFLFTAALIFMLNLNIKLTLYALLPLPFISAIALFFMKRLFNKFKEVQETFSRLTEKAREIISGVRIVQSFQQEESEKNNFDDLSRVYMEKNISLISIWGIMFPLIFMFSEIGTAIILWVGGQQVILNELTLGELVAFFSYLGIIVWPMMAIGMVTNVFQRGSVSLKRVLKILNEAPEIIDSKDAKYQLIKGGIRLENVFFSFDAEQNVLDAVNINIEAGQYVGICGKIGSGKSLIAKLILREISPQNGNIFYDGKYFQQIKRASIRDSIGYVPQDSFLFSTTIEDNVRLGKPDATLEEVKEACKLACIHNNIIRLKDKYKTIVGERGVTLSGGQKQRICIARALIRKSPIIILDDALSAVDTHTENRIIVNLKKISSGMTMIIISHRISAFIQADNIYVIDQGKVENQGTHQQLIEKSSIYRSIYEIQKLQEKKINQEKLKK